VWETIVKMRMISIVEPDVALIEAQEYYFLTFEKVVWLKFMCIFNGHNAQVTKDFHELLMVNAPKLGI
jgi:hypothetical protein